MSDEFTEGMSLSVHVPEAALAIIKSMYPGMGEQDAIESFIVKCHEEDVDPQVAISNLTRP